MSKGEAKKHLVQRSRDRDEKKWRPRNPWCREVETEMSKGEAKKHLVQRSRDRDIKRGGQETPGVEK